MRLAVAYAAMALGIAALASTTPASATEPVSRATAVRRGVPVAGATVDVGVTVPPVVFGGDRLLVFVHRSMRSARATVTGCASVDVPAGVVTALACPTRGTITVRVTTGTGRTFARTYRR